MTDYKTLSVRIPAEFALSVEVIAGVDGKTQVDVIRDAIDAYVETRRADPAFQERLRKHIEADLALLRSLQ